MNKYTVEISGNVDISVIRAALAQLSDSVTVKPAQKRARNVKAASVDSPEYAGMVDLEYRRYCDKGEDGAVYCPQSERWYLPQVMDGVSAQKSINKIMAQINRKIDPHWPVIFTALLKRVPDEYVSADYMNNFCRAKSHVHALYTNGVTA